MKIWTNLQTWQSERDQWQGPLAVTIGNFDGIHQGHRQLVARICQFSRGQGGHSLLITFDPHPLQVLSPEKRHTRLFSLKDQQEVLQKLGIDGIVRVPFSREFSQISPDDFVEEFLMKKFHPALIVVGENFRFGAHRKGDGQSLREAGKKWGFAVELISSQKQQGEVVSTSAIRQHLLQGRPERVRELLARDFYLEGIVEKGEGRGRLIGFPTANIRPNVDFFPAQGVYYCKASVQSLGISMPAVMNIGVNKTFIEGENIPVKFEVHILDMNRDLYGLKLRVELLRFLRPEKKFHSKDELIEQIQKDIATARELYEKN